ncbi:MAG: class II aldolase [Clostridiales bacterium]|nr:class II aldolase [Clostridiales bacterium]
MGFERFDDMAYISREVGDRKDYIQGGGGNTSVKVSDMEMAIKASGCKLNGVTNNYGFAVVNYETAVDYLNNIIHAPGGEGDKPFNDFVKSQVIEIDGIKTMKPSVETGFHAVLKRCVVHTHSVYANILTCTKEGRSIADKLFAGHKRGYIWVDYVMPGYDLSKLIQQTAESYEDKNGIYPEIIFMGNHGIIVTNDDAEECVRLHDEVNMAIAEYLKLDKYPEVNIEKVDEETYASATAFAAESIKKYAKDLGYFSKMLYPDQIVYIDDEKITDLNGDGAIKIDVETGRVIYKATEDTALTMEETLVAFMYIMDALEKCGLTVSPMKLSDVAVIKNWDAEKYRKSMMK